MPPSRSRPPYQLFAGDGHWHAAAAHDPRDRKGAKHATGHVYLQNLRTQALLHLDLCDPMHKRKEHDISIIKRANLDALRGGTPKGTPVILVWDRAIIDYRFLQKVKDQGGLYFFTRPKSNSNLTRSGFHDIVPSPVNEGVLSDELVAPAGTGRSIRRITWQDPDSGEAWQYLTNEMKLPPGLIVLLYRRRWDLEKVYDQFKNKLNEKKSWASSVTAKAAQALFLCLLHNLMVLFEAGLAETGITNAAEEKRRKKVLTERTQRVEKNRTCHALHHRGLPAAHPAHRQIRPMAAEFFLAEPPSGRTAAYPEETLCRAMTPTRAPFRPGHLHDPVICMPFACTARWEIEVFFKQVKQTLRLSGFLGYNANAIRWQVWTALLVYVLLRFAAHLSQWGHSFTRLFSDPWFGITGKEQTLPSPITSSSDLTQIPVLSGPVSLARGL